jgi:HAUS augmin-like complex subunit 4-like protein
MEADYLKVRADTISAKQRALQYQILSETYTVGVFAALRRVRRALVDARRSGAGPVGNSTVVCDESVWDGGQNVVEWYV